MNNLKILFLSFFIALNVQSCSNWQTGSSDVEVDAYQNLWINLEKAPQKKVEECIDYLSDYKNKKSLYVKVPHHLLSSEIDLLKKLHLNSYRIDDKESVWIYRNGRGIPDQGNMVPGIGVILFNQNNQLLLVRNHEHKIWHLPGGAVESLELNIEAAIREVQEELGVKIKAKKLKSVAIYNHIGGVSNLKVNSLAQYFIYPVPINSSEINFDKNEIAEIYWVDIDQVNAKSEFNGYKILPFLAQFSHQLRSKTSKNQTLYTEGAKKMFFQTFQWE